MMFPVHSHLSRVESFSATAVVFVVRSTVAQDNASAATSVAITGINKFKIMNLFQLSARQAIHHRLSSGRGEAKDVYSVSSQRAPKLLAELESD